MGKIMDKINAEMQKQDISVYEVAKRLRGKVGERHIYKIFKEGVDPSTEMVELIIDALGMQIELSKGE